MYNSRKNLAWTILTVLVLLVSQIYAAIPAAERTALIALYNSTNGDDWINNSGWKEGDLAGDGFALPGTENSWRGIMVWGIDGMDHVISIQLNNNNLAGPIPSELGNLTKLTILWLYVNEISGNIPPELGNLTKLTELHFDANQLSGDIPAALGNLTNLTGLWLRSNQLSGSIPTELGHLTNLIKLSLHSNQLSGNIPPELGNLTNLTGLWLYNNQLSGEIPPELGNLTNLHYLYLFSNQLSGSIPVDLTNLTNLASVASIAIGLNALYTTDAALKNLLDGKCANWESTQTVAPTHIDATRLSSSEISVSWTPISFTDYTGGYNVYYTETAGGPYTFAGITPDKSTNSLRVSGLTAGVPYFFKVQTQTNPNEYNTNTVLSDSSAEVMVSISPTERAALIALYNSTHGAGWTNNPGWKTPPLHDDGFAKPGTETDWHGITVTYVDGTEHVSEVNLFSNNLSGSIPTELSCLSEITKISFYCNNLYGPIPSELGRLSNLMRLELFCNSLTGTIPPELGNLSSLETLEIYSNSFTGAIPPELGSLNNLSDLYLYDNQLSSSIPAELGNLSNLKYLNLQENKLSGSIPAELGDLANLEVLSLNANQLNGSIPTELTNLTSITFLDIHYNALYTTDAALKNFLDDKDTDWEITQTVAPKDITATQAGGTGIVLNWTPIPFTDYTGGYKVYYSEISGGPYTLVGTTANKSTDSLRVSGLDSGVPYFFTVQTQTNPNLSNSNTVLSDSSAEIEGIIILDKTKLMATPLAGFPGTTVHFSNACGGKVNRFLWDFGDGTIEGYRHSTMSGQKVNPAHNYVDDGDYTVRLTAFGWKGAPPDTLIMPNLICIDPNYAPLTIIAGSETFAGYDWSKTIDQDVFNNSSKMTANLPEVECVYGFADNSIRSVNRVRLFIDDIYQNNYPGHLTSKFEIWVSVDSVNWNQALATSIPWQYRGQFADFSFAPVPGRYVKLKLTEPHNPNAEIIQLTEFQVFGAKSDDTTLEKSVLAANSPIMEYKLAPNYPNPFNPTTTISYDMPEANNVSLRVYNMTGQMVAELVNGHCETGRHEVVFDGANLSSGTYFCVMQTGNVEQVTRMLLLK